MPYISTEALVGAALVVVLALGYQYIPTSGTETAGGAKKSNKKKNKKKSKSGAGEVASSVPVSEVESDATASKKKGKGKGKAKSPSPAPAAKPTTATPAPAPVIAEQADTDSESAPAPSFAAAAGKSAPAKPKLLAEKILPKPRKTKVDDMLEPHDRAPQIARVMKVVSADAPSSSAAPISPAPASPAEKVAKFEDDYADSTSDSITDEQPPSEDEWNVVSSKKKPVSLSIGGGGSSRQSNSLSGSEHLTKIQRKNQKKAEAKKAQKAAEEADRLRRLAMHKRDLERQRIDEIYKSKQKIVKKHGVVVSAGSTASVSETGKLVWD